MTSHKFFFYDTNAITRYYCNDIGTHIVKQLISSGYGQVMSNYSYVEVVSALSQIKRDSNFTTFNEAEFNIAIAKFESEFDSKFIQIKVNDMQIKKSVELIKNYQIRSADALIVATSLLFADLISQKGHNVTFVTSDKEPYLVALEESKKRSNYKAFHFWKCNCEHCGNTLEVVKAKEVVCNCTNTRCEKCVIGNCTNSLDLDLKAI